MRRRFQTDLDSQQTPALPGASMRLGPPDIRQLGLIQRTVDLAPGGLAPHALRQQANKDKEEALAANARRIVPNPIRMVSFSKVFTVTNTPFLQVPSNPKRRRLYVFPSLAANIQKLWYHKPANNDDPGAITWDPTAPLAIYFPLDENGTNISIDEIWISGTIGDSITIYEGVDVST